MLKKVRPLWQTRAGTTVTCGPLCYSRRSKLEVGVAGKVIRGMREDQGAVHVHVPLMQGPLICTLTIDM